MKLFYLLLLSKEYQFTLYSLLDTGTLRIFRSHVGRQKSCDISGRLPTFSWTDMWNFAFVKAKGYLEDWHC